MPDTVPFEQDRLPTGSIPGLRSPARSVPIPLTPILGREADVSAVVGMLDGDDTRLVTLMGPGGIGKTRLAIEVARRIDGDFAHGACFVALAPVRNANLVPSAVAQALGLQELGERSAAELVVSTLRERHLLLVLDNLEHLASETAIWLSELLGACPRVKALVTSRVSMQLNGERRFLVESLTLPDAGTDGDIARISESAAVELFVQRAAEVQPEFTLASSNADSVRQICRALDGLPLAIELAAARVRVLSPAELLARMPDRLGLLQSDRRDAPPRHRTMRDALDWSHDLLSPEQRRLFRRLAVFTGGFSLDAAEAVGAMGGASRPVLDLLTDLIDHSLVRQVPMGDGGARFGMHELIREHGLEHLERTGEAAGARDAHATWYLALARAAAEGLEGPEQIEWLNRLEAEHDNIRGALAWLDEWDRIEDAQELAGSIYLYFLIRGHFAEGRRLYEDLLDSRHGAARTVPRARALMGLGVMAAHQGDPERSRMALEVSVAIFREHGELELLAHALAGLGVSLAYANQLDESEAVTRESLKLAREIGYPFVVGAALCSLGLDAMWRGRLDQARRLMEESVAIGRETGNAWSLSIGLGNLGHFAFLDGRLDDAERWVLEAAEHIHALGDRRDLPIALTDLADIARGRGDLGMARTRLEEALTVSRDIGDWYSKSEVLRILAEVERSAGDLDRAMRMTREAIDTYVEAGSSVSGALCLDVLADIAVAAGDMTTAARLIGAVDGVRERSGYPRVDAFHGEHEARVASIVAALGEDGYRQAWAGGHALSTDEAITEALAWVPPIDEHSDAPSPPAGSGPFGQLTPRELEVLRLLAEGLTNQQIADRLYFSRRTAASHIGAIFGKLGFTTRTAAVAYAIRNGLA